MSENLCQILNKFYGDLIFYILNFFFWSMGRSSLFGWCIFASYHPDLNLIDVTHYKMLPVIGNKNRLEQIMVKILTWVTSSSIHRMVCQNDKHVEPLHQTVRLVLWTNLSLSTQNSRTSTAKLTQLEWHSRYKSKQKQINAWRVRRKNSIVGQTISAVTSVCNAGYCC